MTSQRPLFAPHFASLVPYVPGKPIEETERQYGVSGIVKLASNENCLGPSPKALAAIGHTLAQTHLYPDAGGFYLKERIAKLHGVDAAQVVLGNGTNELIMLLARELLDARAGDALLNAWPSFVCYRIAGRALGVREITVPLDAQLGYDLPALAEAAQKDSATKLVFIANPNNPTGRMFGAAELDAFFAQVPDDVVVVLDEAYAEYVTDSNYPRGVDWVKQRPRTVVLRTFSKVYGLASLRIGYAVCDPAIADTLNKLRDAFNTSAVAQAAALAALDDDEHTSRSRAHNAKELARLRDGLEQRGFHVTPSAANFVLATVPDGSKDIPQVVALNEALLRRGVIVRPLGNYDLPRSVRISVGTVEENDKLFAALDAIRNELRGREAKPLVVAIDGPAGAGKSTVAKAVATETGLSLVDTGAIYRTVAVLAERRGVSWDDGAALADLARALPIAFELRAGKNLVFVDGEDVSDAIRQPTMSMGASKVSRHPAVRDALLDLQRRLGRGPKGAVLEGRDIGTVVFPDARVKVFLTASPEERARRRSLELAEKGQAEPYDKVLAEIRARDDQDMNRPVAPLKPADDAVLVDSSHLSFEEVVARIQALVEHARSGGPVGLAAPR